MRFSVSSLSCSAESLRSYSSFRVCSRSRQTCSSPRILRDAAEQFFDRQAQPGGDQGDRLADELRLAALQIHDGGPGHADFFGQLGLGEPGALACGAEVGMEKVPFHMPKIHLVPGIPQQKRRTLSVFCGQVCKNRIFNGFYPRFYPRRMLFFLRQCAIFAATKRQRHDP